MLMEMQWRWLTMVSKIDNRYITFNKYNYDNLWPVFNNGWQSLNEQPLLSFLTKTIVDNCWPSSNFQPLSVKLLTMVETLLDDCWTMVGDGQQWSTMVTSIGRGRTLTYKCTRFAWFSVNIRRFINKKKVPLGSTQSFWLGSTQLD